jgi:hypothetical protein
MVDFDETLAFEVASRRKTVLGSSARLFAGFGGGKLAVMGQERAQER